MGFPVAIASKTVSGVPSQSDGNTLRSNADRAPATSRAKPANTNRSPRPSARACASRSGQQRAFADQQEARLRPFARRLAPPRPPGTSCPSIRAAGSPCRSRSRPAAGRARPARRRSRPAAPGAAELLERRAEVHDLHLLGTHEPGPPITNSAVLFETAMRDVGRRLEQPIGDLLIPRRVGEVGVLVENRRDPAPRRRQPAERRGAVSVQMEDVDLLAIDDLRAAPAASTDRICDLCR